MQKRGQVTIFIALGLIILVILSIAFLFKKDIKNPKALIQSLSTAQIESFLKTCIKDNVEDLLSEFNLNGGYFNTEKKITYGGRNVSLYLGSDSVSFVPEIGFLENSLKNKVENDFGVGYCYEQIVKSKGSGFNVNFSNYKADVNIMDNNIDFDFSQDLILIKEGIREIKNFKITIKSELKNFLKIANDRVNSLIKDNEFYLTSTLKSFFGIKGYGYYVKLDGEKSDYEIFVLNSMNNETFVFSVHDPVIYVSKEKKGCCVSKDGLCRQNSGNCDGQFSSQDCNQLNECSLGCCSVAQNSLLKVTTKNECLNTLSTELGNIFSSFGLDLHSNLDDAVLNSCNVKISDKTCSVNVNDDFGIRNLIMQPYTNECSFRSEPDGEHYLLSCQDGVVNAEALGIERLRVCHNNKKAFNNYFDCNKCGEPNLDSDLLLYLNPINRATTNAQCSENECSGKGLCKAVRSDPNINSNVDCLPLYPPNNPNTCNSCGKGGDEKANVCDKEECESIGSCSVAKKPEIFRNLRQSSICSSLIYASVSNPSAASLLGSNCNVNSEDIFRMFSSAETYECKKELFSLKNCDECVNRVNSFERCTKESCEAMNPLCNFVFNGKESCVKGNEEELIITINSPLQNQLFSWDTISASLSVTTNKKAICRYGYDNSLKFSDMLKISEDFSVNHNSNLLIPYSPNDRLLRATISCLGEDSNLKTEFLIISIERKPISALPLIENINLQNKIVNVNERELKVGVDKAVLGCNFIDVSDDLVVSPNLINSFINIPSPEDVYPGSCSYIRAIDKSECKLDINLNPGKFYFYIVNCIDLTGVNSEPILVFFRT